MSKGILLCGHGSRNKRAVDEFATLAKSLNHLTPGYEFEYGYLEFARPVLGEALDRLRAKSIEKVIAIPAMLFAAAHAKNDIPALLRDYSLKTGLQIDYGRELGINNLMIGAAGARIQEVLDRAKDIPVDETVLVVVGRGSSDPDANSNVCKITRLLVEGFGFGWGETVFSGVTFPLVSPGLRHVVRLGFKRIIVFPYFLFSGVLISRISSHIREVAKEFPEVEFIQAGYLGNHPLVLQTFKERIQEVIEGNISMNCSLCKYRSSLLGFEKEVGLLQESHHHHVEGIMDLCSLCEDECSGLCDTEKKSSNQIFDSSAEHSHPDENSHSHSHFPYPHAQHPLGPVTLF